MEEDMDKLIESLRVGIQFYDLTAFAQEPATALLGRVLGTSLLESAELRTATVASLALLVTPEQARRLGEGDPLPLKPGEN